MCISVLLFVGIWILSTYWLLQIKLLRAFFTSLFVIICLFPFPLGKMSRNEFLTRRVGVCLLIFIRKCQIVYKMVMPFLTQSKI